MSGKKERGAGRPGDPRVAKWAKLAGVTGAVAQHWPGELLDQLEGCADDVARRLILCAEFQGVPSSGRVKASYCRVRLMVNARTAKSPADWMEMLAGWELDWIYERAPLRQAPRVKVMAPPKPPPVRVRWVEYGDWSDETGYEVNRMMHLARRSA